MRKADERPEMAGNAGAGAASTPAGRVGMISLGCAKNRVDSEVMLGELRDRGYGLANDLDGAETVIVNTCGFVEEARKESIDAILEVAARKGQAGGTRRLLVA